VKRESLDERLIHVMLANPKSHILAGQLDSQDAVFQRHARRPDFLPVAVAEFLEFQGRVLRIVFEQGELFLSACAVDPLRGSLTEVVCFRLCGRPRRD
jgi:hypothetical protein